jgi:DNA helicase HerA-like ATPase
MHAREMTEMASDRILIGKGASPQYLHLALANRHGLVAGATGTGKTITLQTLVEGFSRSGVPVFCADIKGDLAGLSQPGKPNPKIAERAANLGAEDFAWQASPVVFWDVFGEQGHPVRATVAEMGPLLLARLLDLNETQEGVLAIAFALADDQGLLLLDFKDLRALLAHVAERAGELSTHYGNVSKATIGTIQRRLLTLEQQGAEHFFGEPAFDLTDLMLLTPDGRGSVNILAADKLAGSPRLYATFLLWLLSELFEELPEVGDLDKPKLVFFFDEAHLLFRDVPKALLEKIEQVVRLIRSKGVGVYFVTQNPLDLPGTVLGQLGNRVQHALRAFTPADQKAVRAAAETFRPNPAFRTDTAIMELSVGEALVSTLQPGGHPGVVDRAKILPPRSRMGAITPEERAVIQAHSPIGAKYDTPLDRVSAYEHLSGRATTVAEDTAPRTAGMGDTSPDPAMDGSWGGVAGGASSPGPWGGPSPPPGMPGSPWGGSVPSSVPPMRRMPVPAHPTASRGAGRTAPPPAGQQGGWGDVLSDVLTGGGGRRQGAVEAMAKSAMRSMGSQVGRALVRGVLGSLLKR